MNAYFALTSGDLLMHLFAVWRKSVLKTLLLWCLKCSFLLCVLQGVFLMAGHQQSILFRKAVNKGTWCT